MLRSVLIAIAGTTTAGVLWAQPSVSRPPENLPPTQRSNQAAVPGMQITPHWFAGDDRFWYRKDLPGGAGEYIIVDAVRGQRRLAFDHEKLAAALTKAGAGDLAADRLQLTNLVFDDDTTTLTCRIGRRRWQCNLMTYEVETATGPEPTADTGLGLHPADAPRSSRRTGPESELVFVNNTDTAVRLFWIDTSGRRQSYGVIAAGAERAQHTYGGHVWLVAKESGDGLAAFVAPDQPARAVIEKQPPARRERRTPSRSGRRPRSRTPDGTSPDGKWRAFVRDDNIFVRSLTDVGSDQQEIPLTTDGSADQTWQSLQWSPDAGTLAAFRVTPAERKSVYLVESSPRGGGRAVLHERTYALPGDPFTSWELRLFKPPASTSDSADCGEYAPESWRMIEPDTDPVDFGRPSIRFSEDSRLLTYTKIDRGHQRYRLIAVDTATGRVRPILDEQTDTFIWTAHIARLGLRPVTWLEESDEVVYISEVDGRRHLYLIDPTVEPGGEGEKPPIVNGDKRLIAPGLKNRITSGTFVVRGVDRIDEKRREIWFRASGQDEGQDPYFIHYYRVNFDGTGLTRLTEGNGTHSLQFSPDRRYVIDTYSRLDAAPVHELRDARDGRLVCPLETADVTALEESGWQPPEVFVAKGRDGKTDIWGIICRPADFDPQRKYPVIEDIYAGPHGSFVPKSFSTRRRYQALNELGFIVVKIDGMGTANRTKAFHDVCWHNLKDAGFPDRMLWMKAAAAKDPSLDLDRVGIYGVSAGGQSATAAMLFHPEFYKAAVAGCGCHDNRMDKASWNEQWMGYPVGPQYARSSNIDNAHRLQGELLLIVGEMDTNVPPESTLRLADALIRADKDFDLIVVPGAGHGMGGRYGQRRMEDFFVRHLQP